MDRGGELVDAVKEGKGREGSLNNVVRNFWPGRGQVTCMCAWGEPDVVSTLLVFLYHYCEYDQVPLALGCRQRLGLHAPGFVWEDSCSSESYGWIHDWSRKDVIVQEMKLTYGTISDDPRAGTIKIWTRRICSTKEHRSILSNPNGHLIEYIDQNSNSAHRQNCPQEPPFKSKSI